MAKEDRCDRRPHAPHHHLPHLHPRFPHPLRRSPPPLTAITSTATGPFPAAAAAAATTATTAAAAAAAAATLGTLTALSRFSFLYEKNVNANELRKIKRKKAPDSDEENGAKEMSLLYTENGIRVHMNIYIFTTLTARASPSAVAYPW
ncbi:hypothetical protein E2C01_044837 [Portunus trituberculatus]|uniref:Uncharacterized protein n=1 Tax=Portunus trituberculatus TaxID=210409 RepID=A0A5B7FT55_PORTR|nr:hypothetical protein [Portunus trituberculatus]